MTIHLVAGLSPETLTTALRAITQGLETLANGAAIDRYKSAAGEIRAFSANLRAAESEAGHSFAMALPERREASFYADGHYSGADLAAIWNAALMASAAELERTKRFMEINDDSAEGKHREGLSYRDERDAERLRNAELIKAFVKLRDVARECEQLSSSYCGTIDGVEEHGGDDHEDPTCAIWHRLYYAMFDADAVLEQKIDGVAPAHTVVELETCAKSQVAGDSVTQWLVVSHPDGTEWTVKAGSMEHDRALSATHLAIHQLYTKDAAVAEMHAHLNEPAVEMQAPVAFSDLQSTIAQPQAQIGDLEHGRGEAIHQVRTHGSGCWEDISGESLQMCRCQPEEYEIRTLYSAAPVALVPEGYCIMPKRLTAENGAKALLLGEFKVQVTQECPECAELEEPNEHCKICDGEGEHAIHHTISWDEIKFIYSKAVAGLCVNPIRRDRLTFQFRHPTSSELRSVSLTRAEVAEEMEGTLFEKLVGQLCQCESVGETNVIDCNCNEYGQDFERVAEDDSGATQALPFAFVLPERKGPHQYRDANYTQSCMANEWNSCLDAVAISLGLKS